MPILHLEQKPIDDIKLLGDEWTAADFFEFCQLNDKLCIERNAKGQIIIMSPTGGLTSYLNSLLNGEFYSWNKKTKLGKLFDSNGGFILPNGATYAPDLAWVLNERWDKLSKKEKEQFPPLCPDFVVELRSKSDKLDVLKEKMEEYITNGCRLAWLIDPIQKKTFVYSPNQKTVSLPFSQTLNGASVLPEFELNIEILLEE